LAQQVTSDIIFWYYYARELA